MSRVSLDHHLGRGDLLIACWLLIPQFFALLSPTAQWELHRFYGPSLDLTDEQTLARIKAAAVTEPSLPQRVRKHYKVIFTRYKLYADQVGKENFALIRELLRRDLADLLTAIELEGKGRRPRRVVVCPIVRPDPDVEGLGRLVLLLAEAARKGSPSR